MSRLIGAFMTLAFAAVGCGGMSANERQELEEVLTVAFLRAADRHPFPYHVTQSEFQGDANDLWWVVQLEDPLPAAASRGDSAADATMFWPVEVYRDALIPHWDRLDTVERFILSFRDECQTVFEISHSDMDDFVHGRINEDALIARTTITALSFCP